MPRSRVLSFMSQFGGPPRSPTSASSPSNGELSRQEVHSPPSPQHLAGPSRDSPTPPRSRAERPISRPMSMVQTYQPPLMEVAQDTLPELQPIFSFLNSHSNKLYQEGYFLKLHDLDTHGRPNADRNWTECFAQLVGTVMSLWDAKALDEAGQDGEVVPTFINLTDASIKMIETLSTRSDNVQPLQNVLSISTAAQNRYLLHFNSLHSLTQWTAGIRLAIFEHTTLQEAYTGSLIAGKGRMLNNIRTIMERTRLKTEDWARVRFGAGTPWRRCWCVISPPDEKDFQKQQKALKKKSAYDRSIPILKGNIKFYETKKIGKKTQPIATITDAYSAYAIYPQSKPLIDQSTLVKVEGTIEVHKEQISPVEGFIFVMPEVHPAVTGFEMMLRWLFPVFDTFALYGRPNRLIADTLDVRGLMFALPKERRYGYLEILDVAGLIHTDGSQAWKEQEWRKRMKELTSSRINTLQATGSRHGSRAASRAGSRRANRNSLPSRPSGLTFDDAASTRSSPSVRHNYPAPSSEAPMFGVLQKPGSAPPATNPFPTPRHQRSVSEAHGYERYQSQTPSRLSYEAPPRPPPHAQGVANGYDNQSRPVLNADLSHVADERSSSESDTQYKGPTGPPVEELQPMSPPEPVAPPPAFSHAPGSRPPTEPYQALEIRRAHSRNMSTTTLSQLAGASNLAGAGSIAAAGAAAAWGRSPAGTRSNSLRRNGVQRHSEDGGQRGVFTATSNTGMYADNNLANEGLVNLRTRQSTADHELPPLPPSSDARQPLNFNPSSTSFSVPRPIPIHERNTEPQNSQSNTMPSTYSTAITTGFGAPKNSLTELPGTSDQNNYSGNFQPQQQRVGPGKSNLSGELVQDAVKIPPMPIDSQRPEPSQIQTSLSIARKPIQSKIAQLTSNENVEPDSPQSTSSLGSLRNHAIDQEALDSVIVRVTTQSSDGGRPNVQRQPSNTSSNYDDDSQNSPDYASTRRSTDTRRSAASFEKPRAGVMRTVGTVEPETYRKEVVVGDVHYQPDPQPTQPAHDIPSVDFGPTLALTPGSQSRPSTSGTMTRALQERSRSSDQLGSTTPHSGSPRDAKRNSYGFTGRGSPGPGSYPHADPSSSNRNSKTPEPDAYRQSLPTVEGDNRRSVAWQPGMTVVGGGSGISGRPALTPEQFVQQRAAAGPQASRTSPIYAHQRKNSGNVLRSATPPLPRQYSGDWSQSPNYNTSKELPSRPVSRGGSAALTPNSGLINNANDYSAHLSAREQEHVARVTGSPLISMPGGGAPRQRSPGGGLVGAIEAREREKRHIKEGLSGQMVQNAILQRQQQSQVQNPYGHQNPQAGTSSQMLPNYGQIPQAYSQLQQQYVTPQQYQQQQQVNPQWISPSPAAQVFAQGGGWSSPSAPNQFQQQQYGQYHGNGPQGRSGQGY
ncbi:MAG: hypothetical protein M1827_004368 [Pycnora praestabilis]|nr:MAG: hypothetical protein M1827_004368 [Pycnora praestabilis]